jgi:VanZ family protein
MNPWIPPLLWAATIFFLSSLPGSAYPRTSVPGADKVVHFFLYGVMGVLCARALLHRRRTRPDLERDGAVAADGVRPPVAHPRRALLLAAALATVYGISDELHQLLVPGRSADWRDALTDAIGAVAGSALALWWYGRRPPPA